MLHYEAVVGSRSGFATATQIAPLFLSRALPKFSPMRFWLTLLLLSSVAFAQVSSSGDLANLREDVRLLNQRVGELTLKLEQLERENAALQRKSENGATQAYATVAQLNEAVSELNRSLKLAIASSKSETLQHVAVQMEKLANQTNAAIESIARGQGARVASSPAASSSAGASTFSDSYPKEGISYTVQKGETLARIVQKTGAKKEDIINANKISDPSKLMAGQVLFIPGAK